MPLVGRLRRQDADYSLMRLVIVLAWARAVGPNVVQYATAGRPELLNPWEALPDQQALASQTATLLTWALVAVAALAAVQYTTNTEGRGSDAFLVVSLLPWIAILWSSYHNGQGVTGLAFVYPLLVVAIWQARPPISVLATLGRLVVLTAAASLLVGWVAPDLVTVTNAGFLSKVPFVDTAALAGPFTHPNQLGSFLSLGLPAVLLLGDPSTQQRWRGRAVAVCIVLGAVAWSASRTSMVTAVAVLAIWVCARAIKSPSARRQLALVAFATVIVTMVYLPLAAQNVFAFNSRGRVWIGTLTRWSEEQWFGGGPDAYRNLMENGQQLGPYAFHGHNLFVDGLLVGGLFYLAALAILVLTAATRAARAYSTGTAVFLAIVLAFLVDGVLEVSTNFWLLSPTGLVVWLTLNLVLFASPSLPPGVVPSPRDRPALLDV